MIFMLMSHIGHAYNNVHFQAEKLHRPVHPLSFKLAWLLFMMSISEHMMTPFFLNLDFIIDEVMMGTFSIELILF